MSEQEKEEQIFGLLLERYEQMTSEEKAQRIFDAFQRGFAKTNVTLTRVEFLDLIPDELKENPTRRIRRTKVKKSIIDGFEFRTELAKLIPNYSIDEDNEGQIIIYTNMKETKNGNYKEMEK